MLKRFLATSNIPYGTDSSALYTEPPQMNCTGTKRVCGYNREGGAVPDLHRPTRNRCQDGSAIVDFLEVHVEAVFSNSPVLSP